MLRPNLPPMPERIAALPIDERGYPTPYFAAMIDGKPDFRIADPRKLRDAIRRNLCYVCGQPLGRFKTFPIGPMCSVNRASTEAPSHLSCCEWSVRACPFLLNPKMHRREDERTAQGTSAGIMIDRNPGVIALWTVTQYKLEREVQGVLFRLPDPERVSWWKEGRTATRAEVVASVESGVPLLREHCHDDKDREKLAQMLAAAQVFFPSESEK